MMNLKYILGDKKVLIKLFIVPIFLIMMKYIMSRYMVFMSNTEKLANYIGGIYAEETTSVISLSFFIIKFTAIIWLIVIPIIDEYKKNYIYIVTRNAKHIYMLKLIISKIFAYTIIFSIVENFFGAIIANTYNFACFEIFIWNFVNILCISLFSSILFMIADSKVALTFSMLFILVPMILIGVFIKSRVDLNRLNIFKFIPFSSSNYNFYNIVNYKIDGINETFYNMIIGESNFYQFLIYHIVLVIFFIVIMYFFVRRESMNGN